jgi:hypothetical protein
MEEIHNRPDYWRGYARGLQRTFHGEGFGTEEEHQAWLSLSDSNDPVDQERGVGYRAWVAGQMRARLEYFLIAEDAVIDQRTNNVSIFNVLEQINVSTLPITLPKIAAVTLWEAQEGDAENDFQAKLLVHMPRGQTHEVASNFNMRRDRHRIIQYLGGLAIQESGRIRFEMLLNGIHAADHFLTVTVEDSATNE